MTTVVDPLGTPVPIFNRGGLAIIEVDAVGDTPTSGPIIPAFCGHLIAVITSTENNYAVRLPTDAEVGDLIEVYLDPSSAFGAAVVWSQTGEGIGTSSGPSSMSIGSATGAFLRKVTDTLWFPVRGGGV